MDQWPLVAARLAPSLPGPTFVAAWCLLGLPASSIASQPAGLREGLERAKARAVTAKFRATVQIGPPSGAPGGRPGPRSRFQIAVDRAKLYQRDLSTGDEVSWDGKVIRIRSREAAVATPPTWFEGLPGLNCNPVCLGYAIDLSGRDGAYRVAWVADLVGVPGVTVARASNSKVSIRAFSPGGERADLVLDPARGYMVESEDRAFHGRRVSTRVLSAKKVGDLWVPTDVRTTSARSTQEVLISDLSADVPDSLFTDVYKFRPGDVIGNAGARYRVGPHGELLPLPPPGPRPPAPGHGRALAALAVPAAVIGILVAAAVFLRLRLSARDEGGDGAAT